MIRNCQMPPCKYEDEIDIQRSSAKLCNEAPHFMEYGIKIDPCIRSIHADVLFPPTIKYKNSAVELPTEDKVTFYWLVRKFSLAMKTSRGS